MTMTSSVIHYYRKTDAPQALLSSLQDELVNHGYNEIAANIQQIELEYCYNVLPSVSSLSEVEVGRLEWLLAETFEPQNLQLEKSFYDDVDADVAPSCTTHSQRLILEYGPRMAFTSAFSSNATSICQACGIPITRLELSRRYRFHITTTGTTGTTGTVDATTTSTNQTEGTIVPESVLRVLHSLLHDRMTEEIYSEPLRSFDSGIDMIQPTKIIPIMEQGRAALEQINTEMGLGFDDFDLNYYTNLFKVSIAFACTVSHLHSFPFLTSISFLSFHIKLGKVGP
jgi:phosphoribosylformylglycinamidine synthase